ncbi:hypothetical protein FRZ67_19885 [Panacibacter ginsenosidivorans]|uniref:DUF4136 domain-containing protein n=1 Tax=Panacibacter ginsenosidivorans TaxID=1813871 RepID=A0A5B8VDR1_9BACT|nr:hypothetical protein [Panacibacter ginsenosidivorans]QEC69452.1 hypothetical protein FRZ67_19885 [Panacibacter ginsenosidivorans]
MKILSAFAGLAFTLAFASSVHAQKIKVIEGNSDVLKNETTINFQYTYDNMKVGKFDKEEDYVAQKKEDYNKKEAGKGDNWAKAWVDDRQNKFEPKFEELFLKYSEKTRSKNAKYTLILKTHFTEPGYNVGVWRHNSEIAGEAWIVETANPSTIVAKISFEKVPGSTFGGYDFDTGGRIMEAYALAGKALAKYLSK